MKRRDFLVGSLTLVGLGMGCGRQGSSPRGLGKEEPPGIKGSRRDPSYSQGHRLLTSDFPTVATRVERCRGVILGGGISGLSAAWRWDHAGLKDYCLLELEEDLGGNSRALDYPVTPAPIAAHYLPIPNLEARAVRRVLQEMDVLRVDSRGKASLDKLHLCHSPQERLFYRGQWFEGLISDDILDEEGEAQAHAFHEHILSWRSKRDSQGRKIFAIPLHYSSQEPEYLALDRISFSDYADAQGWTSPVLRWYLDYACRDDFGGSTRECSAWAGLHYFASRDGGGLGGGDDILVWPEGNRRLVRHFLERVGQNCRPQSLVVSAVPTPNGEGYAIEYIDLKTKERVRLEAEVAVYCLPTFTRPYLLKEAPLEGFEYPPWVTANLSLKQTPEDRQGVGFIAWDNVIYDSPSLGYVVATHQDLAFDPLRPTVWTWYRPFVDESPSEVRERLLKARWEDWAEIVLKDLEGVHPNIREVCEQLDVTVLGHGMIRPSVNFLWGTSLREARQASGALFFGHGDLSGMSLFEESQFRGVLAAEGALAHLGQSVESYL